jgi:putative ABC transport system permease protein
MVRRGGWVVLSQALAREHHLHIGELFLLPAPRSTVFRVAGLSTNLGWPAGAVVMNSSDYALAWASNAASAYEIQTMPSVSPSAVRQRVQAILPQQRGLVAETETERQRRHYALADQGLSRLSQIKTLLLIAGVLAVAGAMSSLVWQRRERIAAIRVHGYAPLVLWQWLCVESALVLAIGCSLGAAFGIAGQLLLSHSVQAVTGFPIYLGVEPIVVAVSCLSVGVIAFTIASVPGYFAVHVPPRAVSARQSNA